MMWMPRSLFNFPLLVLLFSFQSCAQCTRQHDPSQDRRLFEQERKYANRPTEKLNEKGEIPEKTSLSDSGGSIDEKYANYCSNCHGTGGKADGPAGQALTPKPRDFTESAWQEKTADDRIATVIKNGGASVGLSATMAGWGAMLSDEDIKQMVIKVRSFKGK